MHHCLSKDELRQLLNQKAGNLAIASEELRRRIELAENWQDEVGALTYLFSHILEATAKAGRDSKSIIATFYGLPDLMSFHIQDFDLKFIEFMLANIRDRTLTLEDELIGLQNRLREHDYGRTLRY